VRRLSSLGFEEALRRDADRACPGDARSARAKRGKAVRLDVEAATKRFRDALTEDGGRLRIDPRSLVDTSGMKSPVPLCLELGAGDGEWAAKRAAANDSVWVVNEYRHDRAAVVLARGALAGLGNVCVAVSDAHTLVARLAASSANRVFVSYPEPPVQTAAAGVEEDYDGRHMLDRPLMRDLGRVLLPGTGFVTIVTDNEWYSKLLLKLLTDLNASEFQDRPFFSPMLVAASSSESYSQIAQSPDGLLRVYAGRPGLAVGHAELAATYFDRLWRTGLSKHSKRAQRFIVHFTVGAASPQASKEDAPKPESAEPHSKKRAPDAPKGGSKGKKARP